MKDKDSERWLKAQAAEKRFWQECNHDEHSDKQSWEKIFNQCFDLTFDFFKNKNILEIGCGPSGIIYWIDEAKFRIGIEPMDLSDLIEDWQKKFVRNGIGEKLPFDDKKFDVVVCFNALDHMKNPESVLQECKRVLNNDGTLLLWLIALREPYKIFQRILNKIDPPHPHHYTVNDIKKLVNGFYKIQKLKRVNGSGIYGHRETSGQFKIFIANYMTENIWLTLKNSSPV